MLIALLNLHLPSNFAKTSSFSRKFAPIACGLEKASVYSSRTIFLYFFFFEKLRNFLQNVSIMLKHLIDFFARTTSPTAPTIEIAWKDILKPKPQRIMLQPARRVTIWKTDEPATKSRQKPAEPCLNMMFKFEHDGQEILIKTRRNLEQNLLGEAFPKITHLIRKKVHRDRQDFIDSPFCMQMSPESSKFLTENSKVVDFLEDERIQAVLVNGEEFRIVRDGLPVQGVSLGLRLLVGLYCMPTVTFNTKNTPIKLHWFVKNENVDRNEEQPMKNKKNVDSPVVRIAKEEENGKFSVEGFSFKSQGAYFIPEAQYLDRKVAVLVDTGEDHPVYASISSKPISEAPEEIITDEQVEWCRRNKLEENPNVLRVLTYNILADLYLNLNLEQSELFFNYCPKAHQPVVYRTPLLLKQISDFIQKSDVSIMFLQEVDVSRHENFLEPFLKTLDFSSVLSKKLHTINEGVAIVFDAKRFRLVDSEGFGLAKLAEEEEENEDVRRILASSELAKERFMSRPTVVQIITLQDLRTNTLLICANTHLHHNPKEEHIKVLQALICIRKVMQFLSRTNSPTRVLFGGDFNSTPGGAVYRLISTGKLPKTDNVWQLDERVKSEDLSIENPMENLTGTPEYTNYTANSKKEGFVGCLDYIWGLGISQIRTCPMPSHEKVIKYTALPSKISPSDHLPIITDIRVKM